MHRLRELDALRGIAVVLFHYTWWYQIDVRPHPPGLWFSLPWGKFGVDLFFLISGFVILMTLERSRGHADFAVSRFARLYPAYAFCSVVTLAVIVLGRFNPNHLTPAAAAFSMTMMAELAKWNPIDPSYWTLTYEVLFYVGAATVYLALGWRRIELPSLVWLAVAAAGRLAHLAARTHRTDVLFDFSYAPLFVAGMMIHRIAAGRASRPTWATLAAAFAVTLLPTEWSTSVLPQPAYVAMATAFAACVLAAARGWLRPLRWAPILFLGDVSYALYLVHQVVGFWIIDRLEAAGLDPNLAIAAAIVAAIGLAAGVRRCVERPAQRAIRRTFAAREAHRMPAVAPV